MSSEVEDAGAHPCGEHWVSVSVCHGQTGLRLPVTKLKVNTSMRGKLQLECKPDLNPSSTIYSSLT